MDILITSEKNSDTRYAIRNQIGEYAVFIYDLGHAEHYFSEVLDGRLCGVLGTVYAQASDVVRFVHEAYVNGGDSAVYKIDGSFLYFEISSKGEIVLFADREGTIPVYYRGVDEKLQIATDITKLLDNFTEDDIDMSSIYDFLRYGALVGENTFSQKVKFLQGGCRLIYDTIIGIRTAQVYFFHYESCNVNDERELFDEIKSAYRNAIVKRVDRSLDQIVTFLSGGMDSRMLLATYNDIYEDKKIACVGFGQPNAEECDVARKVAELQGNPYEQINITPEEFLYDSVVYEQLIAGGDTFAQSYILKVFRQLEAEGYTAFSTGTIPEAHIGGSYLPEDAIGYKGKLSEFVPTRVQAMKLNVFSEEELLELAGDGYKRYMKDAEGDSNLIAEAKKYDDYRVEDVIQTLVINMRSKRLIMNTREIIPARGHLDYINPNFDMGFLKASSKIPAERRYGRHFYRDFFVYAYPEYANIVYNNTTLPISAPFELWKAGTNHEVEREKYFVEIQKEKEVYYPHFYSDFNGYSRKNEAWRNVMEKSLFGENTVLVGKVFSKRAVRKMYDDYMMGIRNCRKQLIHLASLEQYFQSIF